VVDTPQQSLIASIKPTHGTSTLSHHRLQRPRKVLHVSLRRLSLKKSCAIQDSKYWVHFFVLAKWNLETLIYNPDSSTHCAHRRRPNIHCPARSLAHILDIKGAFSRAWINCITMPRPNILLSLQILSHRKGVYIAVTNVSGCFDYGIDDNIFRQVFLTELFEKAKNKAPSEEQLRTASPADQRDPTTPVIPENELLSKVDAQAEQPHFAHARRLTYDTFALALRRIGDKNVLPHVHIMLSFLTTFAANPYVSHLLVDAPWNELAAFLTTLIKTESQTQTQSQAQNVTQPQNTDKRSDELPLSEDYLIRGLIWAHDYFPKKWFEREHDEEERYLELASTVNSRMGRVLRLGQKLATVRTRRFVNICICVLTNISVQLLDFLR
jgi:hypothetical protein